MIGHGEKVEWHKPLPLFAEVRDGLTHGELEGIFRRGAGAEGEGIHRVTGMQMEIAEVSIAERVRRRTGFGRLRGGSGIPRLRCFFGLLATAGV